MKRKGFTLVELLSVIVILALLSVIIITTMSRLLDDSKEKAYNLLLINVENATDSYITNHQDILDNMTLANPTKTIYISDLISDNLLESPLENPKNSEVISGSSTITITLLEDGSLDYTINFTY